MTCDPCTGAWRDKVYVPGGPIHSPAPGTGTTPQQDDWSTTIGGAQEGKQGQASTDPTPTAGAGGGGGGAAGDGGGGLKYGDKYGLAQTLEAEIQKLISGEGTPYSDEMQQYMQGEVVAGAESARRAGLDSAYADLARRGMLQSAAGQGMIESVESQAASQRASGRIDVIQKAVLGKFDAKLKGLDAANNYLESLRNYHAQIDSNNAQRAAAGAQMAAASMNIQWEKEKLESQRDFCVQTCTNVCSQDPGACSACWARCN